MRRNLKPSSFRLWRKRVHKTSIKHRKKFKLSRKKMREKIRISDIHYSMKKVVMYTGNPCPYCVYARALLDSKKIPYQEINVWEDESKRSEMLKKSGGRTSVHQNFIGDHHVGGNDELQAANKSGELDKLLT